jgi:hypothetical protein
MPTAYACYSTMIPQHNLCLDTKQIKRHFLSLNYRGSANRQSLLQFITKFDLLDKFYFSYHGYDRFGVGNKSLYDGINNIIGTTWFNDQVDLEQLYTKIPVIASAADTLYQQNDWSIGRPEYYADTFASVVMETYHGEDIFFTEKIFKPIAFGHPFLLCSAAGALDKLKELGFETFDDIFDESYDTINDQWYRFEHILKEIQRITQLSDKELQVMHQHIVPKLKRNRDYFYNEWYPAHLQEVTQVEEQIRNLLDNTF